MINHYIEIKDLGYEYGSCEVLKNINFSVDKGDICGVFGPNGSGKSTLFKCMLNLEKYIYGEVILDGRQLRKLSPSEMSLLIAYVPQESKMAFSFTAAQTVLMGRTPHMKGAFGPSAEDKEAALNVMKTIGIAHLAKKSFNRISGGERQLVLIARAIAQDTPVIIMDEPSSALDFDNQILLWNIIASLGSQGKTVIVSSHEPNHIMWYCTKAAILHRGNLIACGEPSEVFNSKILESIYHNKFCVSSCGTRKVVHPN